MSVKSGIRLEVRRAAEEDAGKGLARIHPAVMRALGIVNGEFVEILGAKRAVAAAWSSQNTAQGRNVIAIDGEIRSNAGSGIDDRVPNQFTSTVSLLVIVRQLDGKVHSSPMHHPIFL